MYQNSMSNVKNHMGGKESYIEYIRAFAALTVVLLHIVMTLPANYSVEQLGLFNSAAFNCVYMLTKWAVPCFIMVSGTLLLNPARCFGADKIFGYIKRMMIILFTFGTGFALMELVFVERTFRAGMIFKALLNVAEQKSWSHLWYIYVLISLYIVTIPLKYAVKNLSEKEFDILILALIIGNFVIPFINSLAGTEIYSFMIFTEYVTYYLLGYWLTTKKNVLGIKVIVPAVGITVVMIILEAMSIYNNGAVFALNHQSKDIMTLIQSVCVFLLFKELCGKKPLGEVIGLLSGCSFGIYIVHPFWINMIYKMLKITPISMPIGIGIVALYSLVLLLSLGTSLALKKIPYVKRVL